MSIGHSREVARGFILQRHQSYMKGENNLLVNQFDFRKGRSTVSATQEMVDIAIKEEELVTSKSWNWGLMKVCGGQSVGSTAEALIWLLRRPRLCCSSTGDPLSTRRLFLVNTLQFLFFPSKFEFGTVNKYFIFPRKTALTALNCNKLQNAVPKR